MKQIDIAADRYQGQYVVPKAPAREQDEEMRRIIEQMKQARKQSSAK